MKNPCHNTETHEDCSRRCAGCATTCKDWKQYVEERNKGYNNKEKDDYYLVTNYEIERSNKIRKHCKKYNNNLRKFWR